MRLLQLDNKEIIMPIIYRVETDMFVFSEVCSHMVNPVNLMGQPGGGLSLEFRKRVPHYIDQYKEACRSKDLRIGTVQIIEETGEVWGMINLPTKRHYADTSTAEDLARGLEALKDILIQDKYRYSTVGLPMLGVGLGSKDYETVLPMMENYLGNLDACIFLSMSPERTEMRPKYLTIAGPMDYGQKDTDRQAIDWSIDKVMEAWNAKLEDYTGVVSGGYVGVDAYVCGTEYGKAVPSSRSDIPYQDTYVFKKTDKMPIVVKPNLPRNGVGANLHLGNLLCEIGEDVILFKPKGHNNNRLSAMQAWLQSDKEERTRQGMYPRRVAVFGEVGNHRTAEDPLIPMIDDIPY